MLDGVGCLKLIRQHMATAEQPIIIALTASAMRGDRERALDQGFDAYLSKPLVLDELTRCLRQAHQMLARRQSEARGQFGALGLVEAGLGSPAGSRPSSAAGTGQATTPG